MRTVNGIEIPDELDGLDDDFALSFVQEHGLVPAETKTEEPETTEPEEKESESETAGDQTNEPAEDDDTSESPVGDTAPVKEPVAGEAETSTDGKTVPIGAMLTERGKYKAEKRKAEALAAELAQLRAQAQAAQPVHQPAPRQEQSIEGTQQKDDPFAEYESAIIEATQEFVAAKGRDPEPYSADEKIINLRATNILKAREDKKAEQQRQYAEMQRHAKSYTEFVAAQEQTDDFEEVQASLVSTIEAMDPYDKEAFSLAYNRCQAAAQGKGQCDPRDVSLVKRYWNDAATKHRATTSTVAAPAAKVEPAAKPKSAKTAEEKLSEMEKQPKSTLVKGIKPASGATVAEIERLMNEMNWSDFEKKYPEYAKVVLDEA